MLTTIKRLDLARRFVREEEGAVAVVVAMCMVVLLGFAALVLDAGLLFVDRTQLQKAADAAALAGAYDIGTGNSNSADAVTYALDNGVKTNEIVTNAAATSMAPNDSWMVTVQRSVPLTFAPVLGIKHSTVGATATAINSPVGKIDAQYLLPYALWSGNDSGTYTLPGLDNGAAVAYRDNQWASLVVSPDPKTCGGNNQPPCNGNWSVGPQVDFKGFFNQLQGSLSVGSTISIGSKGGNSSEPTDKICQIANASPREPAILPVVGSAVLNSGVITFTIAGFRAVYLDPIAGCGGTPGMSSTFTGTIVAPWTISQATPGGGSGDSNELRVLKIWQ